MELLRLKRAKSLTDNAKIFADSLNLFALGVYFNQCNWANPANPGKCAGDSPDPICPTDQAGRRNCVKFFD
jgi:hypothetical protein